jgi:hypothetical protein
MAHEYSPGERAAVAGLYEQRNVLGSSTGVQISVAQGEELPAAPRGFTWSMVKAGADHEPAERRIEAAGSSDRV